MKMVSAAKLRKAQTAITQIRPYTSKLKEVMENLSANLEGDLQLDLATDRGAEKVLIVLLTSDKGLCGGFNANLIKAARLRISELYADQASKGNVTILPIGKKGNDFFRKTKLAIRQDLPELQLANSFATSSSLVTALVHDFSEGVYDRIEVVYSEFKNAATQFYHAEQFLPIAPIQKVDAPVTNAVEYIIEPSTEEIITQLVPQYLNIQFFRFILDTVASEHGARMTSMDKATENAGELIKALKLVYNRARQAAITTEISEIVGGAAALEG
jgi:F-type H+-transporting ATPase subunit gamma